MGLGLQGRRRQVPEELADLIPLDAHEGVASVVDELVARFPATGIRKALRVEPDAETWMMALSIWTARTVVAAIRESQEGG